MRCCIHLVQGFCACSRKRPGVHNGDKRLHLHRRDAGAALWQPPHRRAGLGGAGGRRCRRSPGDHGRCAAALRAPRLLSTPGGRAAGGVLPRRPGRRLDCRGRPHDPLLLPPPAGRIYLGNPSQLRPRPGHPGRLAGALCSRGGGACHHQQAGEPCMHVAQSRQELMSDRRVHSAHVH